MAGVFGAFLEVEKTALSSLAISGEHGAVDTGVAERAALYDISTGVSLRKVQLSRTGDPHRPEEIHALVGEQPPARIHSPSVS